MSLPVELPFIAADVFLTRGGWTRLSGFSAEAEKRVGAGAGAASLES